MISVQIISSHVSNVHTYMYEKTDWSAVVNCQIVLFVCDDDGVVKLRWNLVAYMISTYTYIRKDNTI